MKDTERDFDYLKARVELLRLSWVKQCAALCNPPVEQDLEELLELIDRIKRDVLARLRGGREGVVDPANDV